MWRSTERRTKVEPASQLRAATMDPRTRTMLRIRVAAEDRAATDARVESLMGRRPELRLAFIQENARFVADLDM